MSDDRQKKFYNNGIIDRKKKNLMIVINDYQIVRDSITKFEDISTYCFTRHSL
jgi:hypothetical protein